MRFITLKAGFRMFAAMLLAPVLACSQSDVIDRSVALAAAQTEVMVQEVSQQADSLLVSPRTVSDDGELEMVRARDWTSGFYPGVLWQLYELTGDARWMAVAREATAKLEGEKHNGRTHDMGFKIYCSFGQGYRLTNDPAYRAVIIEAARTLSTRFNPTVGALRSWDHNRDKWDFSVIIDNMMNLELLFAATRLTGDSSFYHIAVAHANTTLANHFRPDGGTYHVLGYDPETGAVQQRHTHQGYAHESTWARGQAWALYGYTMSYRETKDERYLAKAREIAHWLISHPNLPEDGIPYWDFDAPGIPDEPRDASAAAVIAAALYELHSFATDEPAFLGHADKIVGNLVEHYMAPPGSHRGFILLHSTGSKPHDSEVDVPLVYADYYFLEALLRKKEVN